MFFRDPDGYWLEFCNCEILTDFCLGKTDVDPKGYEEGIKPINVGELAMATMKLNRWKKSSVQNVKEHRTAKLANVVAAKEADQAKLANLSKRLLVWGDIVQSSNVDELEELLKLTGNSVPLVILLLQEKYEDNKHF
jgi:hypothetical protein